MVYYSIAAVVLVVIHIQMYMFSMICSTRSRRNAGVAVACMAMSLILLVISSYFTYRFGSHAGAIVVIYCITALVLVLGRWIRPIYQRIRYRPRYKNEAISRRAI